MSLSLKASVCIHCNHMEKSGKKAIQVWNDKSHSVFALRVLLCQKSCLVSYIFYSSVNKVWLIYCFLFSEDFEVFLHWKNHCSDKGLALWDLSTGFASGNVCQWQCSIVLCVCVSVLVCIWARTERQRLCPQSHKCISLIPKDQIWCVFVQISSLRASVVLNKRALWALWVEKSLSWLNL